MGSDGKICSKKCGEAYTEYNYDTIGGDNFCHKSIQQTNFLTHMYGNEE
jgi:hypothetical protein